MRTTTGPGADTGADTGGHRAWETTLERLELDVQLYARLLDTRLLDTPTDDPEATVPAMHAWDPPSGLGPVPEHLVERARLVAARQADLRGRMHQAMESTRSQRETARRPVTSAFEQLSTPAYLDLRA